jgi:hypothetical protein
VVKRAGGDGRVEWARLCGNDRGGFWSRGAWALGSVEGDGRRDGDGDGRKKAPGTTMRCFSFSVKSHGLKGSSRGQMTGCPTTRPGAPIEQ